MLALLRGAVALLRGAVAPAPRRRTPAPPRLCAPVIMQSPLITQSVSIKSRMLT
ncbi:MAG: hypothetical protein ACXV1K_10735 [Kineosporiaceae bacterium]